MKLRYASLCDAAVAAALSFTLGAADPAFAPEEGRGRQALGLHRQGARRKSRPHGRQRPQRRVQSLHARRLTRTKHNQSPATRVICMSVAALGMIGLPAFAGASFDGSRRSIN